MTRPTRREYEHEAFRAVRALVFKYGRLLGYARQREMRLRSALRNAVLVGLENGWACRRCGASWADGRERHRADCLAVPFRKKAKR
jgi:hypothetical protein